MAVFVQLDTCYAVGFDTLTDATDFLFWGYEEQNFVPCGTFDMLTGEVASYEHRGRDVGLYDPDLIRQTATDYVRAALRLAGGRPTPYPGKPPGLVL